MRYLFIVGHPAHVHLFKNIIAALRDHGHQTLIGAVSREVTTQLLDAYQLQYFVFGGMQRQLLGKALGTLPKNIVLLLNARRYYPDVLISTGSPYAAQVSAILDKPHIAFGDTEHATLVSRLMLPFTDAVCTPDVFEGDLGPKQVRYRGYKELAYVHPKYFTPDPAALEPLGLSESEPYVIVRFASWDASHDLGNHGLRFHDVQDELAFVNDAEHLGRVIATSERTIKPPLDRHALSIPPERMHHVLAFARAYVGEGATMAAEAGVLGVPWVFISQTGRGFLSDQQDRYGLGFWVRELDDATNALAAIAQTGTKQEWKRRRDRMLADKEDVVLFASRFIEEWPRCAAGNRKPTYRTA